VFERSWRGLDKLDRRGLRGLDRAQVLDQARARDAGLGSALD
jgi:hypothetical protein